jgi:hypothetical protein
MANRISRKQTRHKSLSHRSKKLRCSVCHRALKRGTTTCPMAPHVMVHSRTGKVRTLRPIKAVA